MDLAGDLVHSLAVFLNIEDLKVRPSDFSNKKRHFRKPVIQTHNKFGFSNIFRPQRVSQTSRTVLINTMNELVDTKRPTPISFWMWRTKNLLPKIY